MSEECNDFRTYRDYHNCDRVVEHDTFAVGMALSDERKTSAILASELAADRKMVEVYTANSKSISDLDHRFEHFAAEQMVNNTRQGERIARLEEKLRILFSMTKIGIKPDSIWPEDET